MQPVIIIPARMASTRLPGKPLADIAGTPMIMHVVARALEADIAPVYVAVSEQEVYDVVSAAGANAIMTDPAHPSGTDRIFQAVEKIDPNKQYDVVINLQGDLPTVAPSVIKEVLKPLQGDVDIATLAVAITEQEDITNPNIVKPVISFTSATMGNALYFSREAVPHGADIYYHHIGIYAYRRDAIERFTALAPSPLEQSERLEQLRALENGMKVAIAVIDAVPFGVDTQEDLNKARALLG